MVSLLPGCEHVVTIKNITFTIKDQQLAKSLILYKTFETNTTYKYVNAKFNKHTIMSF